jgi:hypothetical protein
MTVSLEVPYTENEQQFLALVVQTAVKTFRSLNTSAADDLASEHAVGSIEAPVCSSTIDVAKDTAKQS